MLRLHLRAKDLLRSGRLLRSGPVLRPEGLRSGLLRSGPLLRSGHLLRVDLRAEDLLPSPLQALSDLPSVHLRSGVLRSDVLRSGGLCADVLCADVLRVVLLLQKALPRAALPQRPQVLLLRKQLLLELLWSSRPLRWPDPGASPGECATGPDPREEDLSISVPTESPQGSLKVLKNQAGPASCRLGFFLGHPILTIFTCYTPLFAQFPKIIRIGETFRPKDYRCGSSSLIEVSSSSLSVGGIAHVPHGFWRWVCCDSAVECRRLPNVLPPLRQVWTGILR